METTILIDLNNLYMRNAMTGNIGITEEEPEYQLLDYVVFEQIYWYYVNFRKQNNVKDVILCVDGANTWRKIKFPRYKEDRYAKRESSDIDWEKFYSNYDEFQLFIEKYTPFKVIKVNRAEADDIIGSLCINVPDRNFIIVSNDQDFKQLTGRKNVKLYSPNEKKFVVCENVDRFKEALFLKGQSKDNIFNVKTPNDYPKQLRKPPLGDKTAEKILDKGINDFLNTKIKIDKKYEDENGNEVEYKREFYPLENYKRNKLLIDFELIPRVVCDTIIKKYENYQIPSIEKLFELFESMGWRYFLENFEVTRNVLRKLEN